LAVVIGLFIPITVNASSSGPPNGKTGAPGEGTCHDCHNSFDLNSGSGALTIIAPEQFEAEQTYEIVVSLEQAGQARWGFEFSPLEIGTCTITDPATTQLDVEAGKTYVKQTSGGTFAGETAPVTWAFQWTAPADPPDAVTFYAAGNAANNNGSTSGDYIYTTSHTATLLPIDVDGYAPSPRERFLLSSHPNPARESVVISYHLPHEANASMRILDIRGAVVWQRQISGGSHSLRWHAQDETGTALLSGLYFCRIAGNDQSVTIPVVLMR
jgi:hypothetical protein